MKTTRTQLLKRLRRSGAIVSLIAVMAGAGAMTGCVKKDENGYYHPEDEYHEYVLDTYIVINGVVHYGSVYEPNSDKLAAETDIKYYTLADGSKFFFDTSAIVSTDHQKPNHNLYETECEECMHAMVG